MSVSNQARMSQLSQASREICVTVPEKEVEHHTHCPRVPLLHLKHYNSSITPSDSHEASYLYLSVIAVRNPSFSYRVFTNHRQISFTLL